MVPLQLATTFRPQVSLDDQAELASGYFQNAPHLISYPTEQQFRTDFLPNEFNTWENQNSQSTSSPLSLYVHLPFCKQLCYFCSSNKTITRQEGAVSKYLTHLQSEISMRAKNPGKQRPITSMHWGGGTPSYLDSAEITRLMYTLASHFNLLADTDKQYSIEIDPRCADAAKIALLKGLGFNQISMGVQDFDPLVQRAINRVQSYRAVAELVDSVRAHGFATLTFDLIYGLPHQDTRTLSESLKKVIDLRPDCIACRGYHHMPNVFSSHYGIDRTALPNRSQSVALLKLIHETLGDAGYENDGVDHFVLANDALVAQRGSQASRQTNSQCDLLGLGVSAISHIGEYVVQNELFLDRYYQRTALYESPIHRGLKLSEDDKIRRFIIRSFAINQQLNFDELNTRFGISFPQMFASELSSLREMHDRGLVEIGDHKICVTTSGRPFVRNVCTYFDSYLKYNRFANLASGKSPEATRN